MTHRATYVTNMRIENGSSISMTASVLDAKREDLSPREGCERIPRPVSILGVNVHPFGCSAEVVRCISARIANNQRTFCIAINPLKVCSAIQDARVAAVLETADLCICDGIGVTLASWLLYGKRLKRCTDTLFDDLVERAAANGWSIFLLGATRDSNERAFTQLRKKYPGLRIAGRRDGYFQDSEEVVHTINKSGADLLFVAMGSPRQELWIAKYRKDIATPFCMGVGGAVDVISGKVKRAPRFFRAIGLEFLYRLIAQPTRFRRQLALPKYTLMVLKAKGRGMLGKHCGR